MSRTEAETPGRPSNKPVVEHFQYFAFFYPWNAWEWELIKVIIVILLPEIHKSKNKLYLDFSKSSTIIKETKTKLVIF